MEIKCLLEKVIKTKLQKDKSYSKRVKSNHVIDLRVYVTDFERS